MQANAIAISTQVNAVRQSGVVTPRF